MPQQDEWKPVSNTDWVPLTTPKPLDTRLKDPITGQVKTNILEPSKPLPLSELENIRFSGPPNDIRQIPKEHSWGDTAVAMGLRTVPPLVGGVLGGVTAGIPGMIVGGGLMGAQGEEWASKYLGEPQNRALEMTEGVLSGITAPFGPAMPAAKEGIKAIGKYALKNAALGGVLEGASSVPRHIASTGRWELPSAGEAGTQAMFGAGFGGLTGGAIAGANRLRNFDISVEPFKEELPSNDVLSQSPLDTSTQVELFDKGLTHEQISKITPEEANNILGGGAGHVRPSIIDPTTIAGIRQQARAVEPPPPIVEQGAPSIPEVPQAADIEPVPFTEGQDVAWPRKPTPEAIEQFKSEGYAPQQDELGNWFFRLIREEIGTFDPVTMWKTVRQYFGGPEESSRTVDDWRQALIRAGAAGDEEATNIIAAHVRELESQAAPPIMQETLGEDWIPEPETIQPARTMGEHASEASDAIATDRVRAEQNIRYRVDELEFARGSGDERAIADAERHLGRAEHEYFQTYGRQFEPTPESSVLSGTEFEPDPTSPLNEPYVDPTADPASRPATIVANHMWQIWDLMDRWTDLRNRAREAGDDVLRSEATDHIRDLDVQMDNLRGQPFGQGNVEVLDPTPFETAAAHLPPASTPSRYGASFPESVRNYVYGGNQPPPDLIPYTPGVRTPLPSQIPPRILSTTPLQRAPTDVIRQQMDDLGVPPEQEQWYRGLNDESLEFPEEGNQPTQDILGLREMNQLGEIEGARIPEFDPNFAPKDYTIPEAEHLWEPKLKLREPIEFTSADIDRLEESVRNAPSNNLGEEYGRTGIEYGAIGKPGLEIKKTGNRISARWRDKNGKVTAIARGGPNGIDSLAGKKIKADVIDRTGKVAKLASGEEPSGGIGGGRGNFEVLRGLVKHGIPMLVDSSLSPYSRGMLQTFIKQARRLLAEQEGSLSLDPEDWKAGWKGIKESTGWGEGTSGKGFKFSDVIEGRAREKEEAAPNVFKEAWTLPTVATTVADLSGPGRQGFSQILTPEFWKAAKDMSLTGAWTKEGFDRIDAEVRNLPLFKEYRDPDTGKKIPSKGEKMGIKISAPGHRLGPREEGTASRWIETGGMFGPETIKGYTNPLRAAYRAVPGNIAAISNRGLTTFLNVLRANRAQKLMDQAAAMANIGMRTGTMPMEGVLGGVKLPDFLGGEQIGFKQKVSMEEAAEKNPYLNDVLAREIGDFVNTATGRGPLKTHVLPFKGAEVSLEGAADKLGYAFFSPRNFTAKTRMMNPSTYIMASPFVRKQYLKSILATGMAWYTFAELAKMADPSVEVNTDPTNADFGKIRIGDFRMDPGGGFQQFLVLYARLMAGGSTSSASNRFRKFGSSPVAETAKSTIERFGANKLNPVSRFAYDFASASKRNPFQVMDRTMQMYLPLIAQDAYEIYKEDPDLLPWMAPIAYGFGSQIYGKEVSKGRFIDPKNDWTIKGGGPMDWFGQN